MVAQCMEMLDGRKLATYIAEHRHEGKRRTRTANRSDQGATAQPKHAGEGRESYATSERSGRYQQQAIQSAGPAHTRAVNTAATQQSSQNKTDRCKKRATISTATSQHASEEQSRSVAMGDNLRASRNAAEAIDCSWLKQ